ncbi:hypothetical protein CBI38_33710 (plasmid) [Rhodococcus oxybenzonivorans]|uniref:Uncharacterized protein n=1 Tax=Rhodococcus oxybenzonivorans TaxID=1990687 RepID=A0A2S2C6B3_9NOCA|nr:hypothetical protein CBI38_33710 [Rhodococcus oxybenzonivorans]
MKIAVAPTSPRISVKMLSPSIQLVPKPRKLAHGPKLPITMPTLDGRCNQRRNVTGKAAHRR